MLLRVMTLPEGLAGHCLTVIGSLLLPRGGGMKGWRSKAEREGQEQMRARDLRERETTIFYGDQSSKPHCLGQLYRIYWTVPHYPAPHPSNCSLFSALFHAPLLFWFPTRRAFSRTLERCKSNTMSTSAFYSNTQAPALFLTHTHTHSHKLALKNWGRSSERALFQRLCQNKFSNTENQSLRSTKNLEYKGETIILALC